MLGSIIMFQIRDMATGVAAMGMIRMTRARLRPRNSRWNRSAMANPKISSPPTASAVK